MYAVEYRREATKDLRSIARRDRERIVVAIQALAQDPLSGDIKKLADHPADAYRLRVGRYRVIYTIDHGVLVIYVVNVLKRGQARLY